MTIPDWLQFEEGWLAPYAMPSRLSRGRRYPEDPHPYRTIFQRDRERIVHCAAFRRLMGKTQVIVAQWNDHHRTRLTHTLEVAQISRTIARRLRLNEDLVEAIALSHDLGHPPFGHAGEAALDECLRQHGGFDHNLFGLYQVDEREHRYPEFPGLNLSWEVREAFVQHSQRRDLPETAPFFAMGAPLLEAQVVDLADSLAYDTHDIDDALGTELLTFDDLESVEFWCRAAEIARQKYPELRRHEFRVAVIRHLIAWQVGDLIEETSRRLQEFDIRTLADVRNASVPLVGFGPEVSQLKADLEQFLHQTVYQHHRVLRLAHKGKRILKALFAEFVRSPELLPPRHLRRWQDLPPTWLQRTQRSAGGTIHDSAKVPLERVVGDYLAGMTDRFAQQEYLRLFQPSTDE